MEQLTSKLEQDADIFQILMFFMAKLGIIIWNTNNKACITKQAWIGLSSCDDKLKKKTFLGGFPGWKLYERCGQKWWFK